ncbi:MAG: hypothetical protein ACPGUC_00290 [Gammaproteobacteria bacterium]
MTDMPIPRQIAFIAMPFRERETGVTDGSAPTSIDFDHLSRMPIRSGLWTRFFPPSRA